MANFTAVVGANAIWQGLVVISRTICACFSRVKSLMSPLLSCALQRLRMMIKPVVLVKSQENGPDQQTENQSQNPANEEAYI